MVSAGGLLAVVLVILTVVPATLLAITPWLDRFRREALRRILKDVTEVMNRHGINYWADFGTLLGLARDGDVILGDKDVDLCVLDVERPRVMAAQADFAARGYLLTDEGGAARRIMRVFDRRTPFYVDIYPFVHEGDTFKSPLDPREDAPAALVMDRTTTEFQGVAVSIPKEAERLLEFRYGPTFKTPRRNDKGRSDGTGLWHSLTQDLEASALFVWFLMRRAFGARPDGA